MKKADLHIHTVYSDGTYSPQDIVDIAIKKKISAIAVTDHDITYGIEPAIKYGAKKGVEIIPGVEISCQYNSSEIHILGYYINWENSWFQNKLKVFQNARERRAFHILNKLRMLGIKIDEQMLFAEARSGSIGRLHFARCLIKLAVVQSIPEAFDKYLKEGRPAFVKRLYIPPEEALDMIHRVGGISVVAHPTYGGGNVRFLKKLKRRGLWGIEAYHPGNTPQRLKRFLRIAKELNLIVTGGSDAHGGKEGKGSIGSVDVDYITVDNLKKAKRLCDKRNKDILKC